MSYKVFLQELAARLANEGWIVHLACSSTNYPGHAQANSQTTVHEISIPRAINLWSYYLAARQLRQVVARVQPNVIHAHFQPAVISAALARRAGWPATLGTFQGLVHTTMPRGPRRWLYRLVERWASRRLDRIWLLTPDDLAAMPLPNVQLQSAPGFGADQTRFDPSRFSVDDRAKRRQQLGIEPDALVFIYVGRQTYFKGFPETSRAALAMTQSCNDVHFIMVGTSDPQHADGLNAQERAALSGHPRIHVLGWERDVAALLHASDCFVFPSTREGLAVCIMEALSMGLPVVTTPARGCRELVQHGHNGWIVERDSQAVFAQLLHIRNHPQERLVLGANAVAERSRFSREHFVREQMVVYRELIGAAPRQLV